MLNSELLQPNWVVRGRAKRLKNAVAEVKRLWIHTPANTRHLVAFVIFIFLCPPTAAVCPDQVPGRVQKICLRPAGSQPVNHIGNILYI